MAMPTPILEFRCMRCFKIANRKWIPLDIPNGYRWATVEEVRNHFNNIAHLGIPPLHPHDPQDKERRRSIAGGAKMYLLDGYMTYPSHDHFQLHQTTCHEWVYWKVVVKEREWDKSEREWDTYEGTWRSKRSANYSSDGRVLRKRVYDHLTLSPKGRQCALLNPCCFCVDVEVLYWLLKTSSSQELEEFKLSFDNFFCNSSTLESYLVMVRSLLSNKFPFKLPLDGNTAMDYAFWFFDPSQPNYKKIGISVVELLVELFFAEIVHWENSSGMSFLDLAQLYGNNWFIHICTQLLSVSQQPLANHVMSIKPHFQAVFSEAFRRGYVSLLQKLLDFIRVMTIDIPLLIRDLSAAVDRRQVPLVEKLLEFEVHEQINMDEFVEVFEKAVCKGHSECVQKLLELLVSKVEEKIVWEVDGNEKTLIQYAAEYGEGQIFHLLVQKLQSHGSNLQGGKKKSQNLVRNRDKLGRSILHWASLVGEAKSCEICVKDWKLGVETKESSGQNSLHYAAKGMLGHQVVDILIQFSSKELIHSTDYKGRTPFHLAAAVGNIQMAKKLLYVVGDSPSQLRYIQHSDSFGRTALHIAVDGGHQHLTKLLLERRSDPLRERDMLGQTSLHYATQVEDPEVALAISPSLLDKYERDSGNKSLLMWASAPGIGTAEEKEQMHSWVRDLLEKEKDSDETHLLRAAAVRNNLQMAWELVNRGANLADIYDGDWRKSLSSKKNKNVENVIKQIELANKRGTDKPTLEDKLGRSIFVEGLAALFLNKFIESPITVGISGDWGMGKSSLMFQNRFY